MSDPAAWMKKDPNCDGFSFVSTNFDGFLINGMDHEPIMETFELKFDSRCDELNPTSYLVLEWETFETGKFKIHNQKHIKESLHKVKSSSGIQLKKESAHIHPKNHPDVDESRLLINEEITEHQKFVGALQCIQSSLRLDTSLAVSSLARFQCNPRECHLSAVIKICGFLKRCPKRLIVDD